MRKRHKATASLTQRVLLALCGILVVVTTTGTVLLRPQPAQAIFGVGDISFEVNQLATFIWEKAQDGLRWAMDHGAALAFKNALRTFTQRMAYDTAVMLASGGRGQTPLLSWRSLGESATRAYDDAAGDFLDTLDTSNGFIRLGLCKPVGFDFRLVVNSALFQEIQPRRPRCTLSDIERNIDRYRQNPEQFLDRVGVVFDPKQNELGVALHLQQTLIQDAATKQQMAVLEQGFNQGFKDITEDITGFIKTPASRVRNQAETSQEVAAQDFSTYTGDILADALGVFTNTLAARLMKRLLQGDIPNPSRLESRQFGLTQPGQKAGVDYAVQVNTLIASPQIVGGQDMDVISEYSTCPQDVRYASVNNCTVTERFAAALRKADEGQPMTLQEAIDGGFINGELRFALVRTSDDSRAPSKYWYLSDIKKLRKARIVSLGWELAAQAFSGTNVTLQKVIGTKPGYSDGFNSTGPDQRCGTSDDVVGPDGYNFCGLIDPNWVLKAPAQQCRILGYGQLLESESPNRAQTCVDAQQCIAERPDGSCLAWGYCTEEKNTWRFAGQSCEFPQGSGYSPYSTCQTFTNRSGKTASYLRSSLMNFDDGLCSSAVGCKWYSASLNSSSSSGADRYRISGIPSDVNTVNFTPTAATAPKLYLKEAERYRCTSKEEGCTEFLRLSSVDGNALGVPNGTQAQLVAAAVSNVAASGSTNTYEQYAQVQSVTMKEAPAYLNCYDIDPSNDAPECKSYALSCSADEVGCELYTPADGSPAVPGIATTDNICPQACVGLNEYGQQPSFFEPAPTPPTHRFIPSTALQCSAQYVGCEEFTNVEQNERREYYSELRQCVRPGESDATYYTWVGSDLTGYQLKTWQLEGGASQPPVTTDGSGDCRVGGAYPTSDPDCKEFYDQNGNPHYRFFTKTRSASEQCNRYRRTGTVGVNFEANDCTSSGGSVEGNFCFYRAIPSQGKVCAAQFVGCREFRGPTASNVRFVFPVSTFGDREAGVNADSSPTSGWTGGSNSNESTTAFGHSYDAYNGTMTHPVSLVEQGRQYTLTFWIRRNSGPGYVGAELQTSNGNIVGAFAQVPVDYTEWQLFSLGPIEVSASAGNAVLEIRSSDGDPFYIDNIQFREVQDSFFVRKNSWNMPSACDANLHLRCSAYRTRSNQQVALTGFSRICRNEVAGCEALVNTQNSSSPREQTFTVGGQSVSVPADQVAYRVYDSKKICSAGYAGCRRVGDPTMDASGDITQWSDVFMRLDPDTFDAANPVSPLCDVSQDGCEEYTDTSGASHYFKDPKERLCEYKIVDTQRGYDWYKKGTDVPCNLVANPSFENYDGGLSDGEPDSFASWSRNSNVGELFAEHSLNGRYWGGTVVRVRSADVQYSGIWSSNIPLPSSENSRRFFAISARVWVPADAEAEDPWSVENHAYVNGACSGGTCHHYTFVGGVKALTRNPLRDQWVTLSYVIRVDEPGVDSLSVGLVTNNRPSCTAVPCVANQEILMDDVRILELPGTLTDYEALQQSTIDYAYLCPSDQAGCTAFYDGGLTKKTYYYLNDERIDATTCSGRVSEKEGCVLFNDLSKSSAPIWSSGLTYTASRNQNNQLVSPVSSGSGTLGTCSRNTATSCQADADCGGICQSTGSATQGYCSNDRARTCATAIDCVNNAPSCLANRGVCSNDATQMCTTNSDCNTLAKSSLPTFQMSIPQCFATEADCRRYPQCSCQIDTARCGGTVPYICYSGTAPQPVCEDTNVNRCSNNPLQTCTTPSAQSLECVPSAPTCNQVVTTGRACSNIPGQTCTGNADCVDTCVGQASGDADSNVVLKVRRDRTCGEWLSCQSEQARLNPQSNTFDSICYSLGACNSLAGTGTGSSARCGNWLSGSWQPNDSTPQVHSLAWYQRQPRNWDDPEYSGYSMANVYPLDALTQKNYSTDQQGPDYKVTYQDRTGGLYCNGLAVAGRECSTLGSRCSDGTYCEYRDRGINGEGPGEFLDNVAPRQCRIYPQADAPFPAAIASEWKSPCQGGVCPNPGDDYYIELPERLASGFSQANVCQPGEVCECSYQRVAYSGGEQVFYSISSSQVDEMVAVDEGIDGAPLMSRIKRRDIAYGQSGYCVEKDTSRVINAGSATDYACLTWYPTDAVGGEISVYDYSPEAGYQGGSTYYCSEAKGNRKGGTSAYLVGAHNGQLCPSGRWGVVGGDNWYCAGEGFTIAGAVNTCALFNVPAETSEQGIVLSDVESIDVHMVGYYGSGLGGGQYINGNFQLDEDSSWCGGGSSGTPSVTAACNSLSGDALQAPAGPSSCIGGPDDYAVIKAVFNAATKAFLGYNVMVGDGSGDSGGATMTTGIRLREYCTETVQTSTNVSDKAWTDRVLRRTDYNVPPSTLNFWNYRPDAFYGKLPLSGTPTGQLMYVTDSNQQVSIGGRQVLKISTPYSCSGNCGTVAASNAGTCSNSIGRSCVDDAECTIQLGGSCNVGGASCQADSDCPANTCEGEDPGNGVWGQCTAGGAPCEINSDCATPAYTSCTVAPPSTGTCVPPTGTGNAGMCIAGRADRLYQNCDNSSYCSDTYNSGICMGYFSGICNGGARDGESCLNNSSCSGGGTCENLTGMNSNTGTAGRESLNEIFAKEFNRYRYQDNRWDRLMTDSDVSGSALGSLAPGVPAAPEIKPVLFDNLGRPTGEGGGAGFTIVSGGRAYAPGSNLTIDSGDGVSVAFYAYNPNGEQMPLNRVLVDWDDGSPLSGSQGKFKNRKHDCKEPEEAGYNWGDDPRACIEDTSAVTGYFNFTKVYVCPSGETCTFAPKVLVQDNWEWCRGGAGGMWKNDCELSNIGAWLPFGGTITIDNTGS